MYDITSSATTPEVGGQLEWIFSDFPTPPPHQFKLQQAHLFRIELSSKNSKRSPCLELELEPELLCLGRAGGF